MTRTGTLPGALVVLVLVLVTGSLMTIVPHAGAGTEEFSTTS